MTDHRKNERFHYESRVMLEDYRTGYKYQGMMYNHSSGGMYVESDYAPRPLRKLRITVERPPSNPSRPAQLAEVRWRRPLNDHSSYKYGIGVRYC